MKITHLTVKDVRFPTSESLAGSDALNHDPDYSAAYVILSTDQPRLEGHGLTFTIGRGNEICCAAIRALAPLVVGLDLDWIKENGARFWRRITGDSQLRWIGPDKGAIHMATGAVVNAVWDLWEGRAQTGLAPGRRYAAGANRRARRFPLSHGCDHSGGVACDFEQLRRW